MEEKVEESVEVVEGKGMEIVTKGESSFSHALEEEEIDEPYVPDVCGKGIHCGRVHR